MNRKQFMIVLVVAAIFGLMGGAASELIFHSSASAEKNKLLAASEIRLVDEIGRTRALLSLLRGRPRLIMLDEKGEFRLELGMESEGDPAVWLRDANGRTRAQLGLTPSGNPSLEYTDQKGWNRLTLGLGKSGDPALFLRDDTGRERVAVWQEKGEMGLALADIKGRPRGGLSLKDGENPSLAFYDENLKIIWLAPPPK